MIRWIYFVVSAECKDTEFEVRRHDPSYQSADVLFVLEDSSCNTRAANSLMKLVTKVNQALESAGL